MDYNKIGIVIIDSIAGIFRTIDCDIRVRAIKMRNLVNTLNKISLKYECAILCTNQIASFEYKGSNVSAPALGLAWANLITSTRIVLSKNDTLDDESMKNNRKYKFQIKNSPYLEDSSCYFSITKFGVINAET